MVALSIIHGDPAPTFFADPVIDYLFGEKRQFKASYEDIPDLEIRQKVEKVGSFMLMYFVSCNER